MKLFHIQAAIECPSNYTEIEVRSHLERHLLTTKAEKDSLKISESEPPVSWQARAIVAEQTLEHYRSLRARGIK